LFIGFTDGWLSIFDIQKNQTIKSEQVLRSSIYSIACMPDNSCFYVNDYLGSVKLIKRNQNATPEDEFDLTEEAKSGPSRCTKHISLTKDGKKLLICSKDKLRLCWPMLLSAVKDRELGPEYISKCIKYIDGGKNIFLCNDFQIRIIDAESFKQMQYVIPHEKHTNRRENFGLISSVLV